jgi:cytochrome c-type biogenesis protein CcmF
LAVTEKRGGFKSWTVLLAITAFSLSLLGTFLVRSGVLTSVHAFATDPRRGIFILIFLALVVGSSLTLYAWRAPKNTLGGKFTLSSRETFILLGNVFLVVAAGSVLLGTLYPLLIDALHLGKISVGPPYFNSVFVPIMIPLLVLMGIGPWANWKNTDLPTVIKRLWFAALVAILAGVLIPLIMGQFTWLAGLGFLLAFWIIASGCQQIIRQARLGKPTRSFIGMQIAHLGIAIFVIGVTMVGAYQEEKDVRMLAGDTVNVGGYQIRLVGISKVPGPNYEAIRGNFLLTKNGNPQANLYPEKRSYFSSTMPMTEAAINVGLTRDIYVSLGEELSDKAWAVRVYFKPFVDWIWGGCLLMALGGVLAISDKRYRMKLKKVVS